MILRLDDVLAGDAALMDQTEPSDAAALKEIVALALRGGFPDPSDLKRWLGDEPEAALEAVLAPLVLTLAETLQPLADGAPPISVVPEAMRKDLGDDLSACMLRHPGEKEIARIASDAMLPLLTHTPFANRNERLARLLASYVFSYFGALLPVFGPDDRDALLEGRTKPARLRLLLASKLRAAIRSRDGAHALFAATDGSDWYVAADDPEIRMLVDWGELRSAEANWERQLSGKGT